MVDPQEHLVSVAAGWLPAPLTGVEIIAAYGPTLSRSRPDLLMVGVSQQTGWKIVDARVNAKEPNRGLEP